MLLLDIFETGVMSNVYKYKVAKVIYKTVRQSFSYC